MVRDYDADVVPGLEEFAAKELRQRLGPAMVSLDSVANGQVRFRYRGDARRLNEMRTVIAVHREEVFDVPRPKALLGQEHLDRLIGVLEEVVHLHPPGAFSSFRVSAAGSDSPAFLRLKSEIAARTGLRSAGEQADLLIAVRRVRDDSAGWQIRVRLSPRPLSARSWRIRNLPGALNATVARVMVELSRPSAEERFLNVGCGSGTLMVERLALGRAGQVVGIDRDETALRHADENLAGSGHRPAAGLARADAAALPFPASSFDTIVADLPYGMLVGTPHEIEQLYPDLAAEATRVAAANASLVVITTRHKLFESAMARFRGHWLAISTIPIRLSFPSGYIYPTIYHYRRAENP